MTSSCAENEQFLFRAWLVLLAIIWTGIAVAALLLHEYLVNSKQTLKWLDYTNTICFFLLFIRVFMHHTTLSCLHKWSKTFKTLPKQVQDDSAFAIVDSISVLFFGPTLAYAVVMKAFTLDSEEYFATAIPVIKAFFPYYMMDRALHIWVNPLPQRAIHHFVEICALLLVLEWNPSTGSLCVLVYGGILDTYLKPVNGWHMVCRYTRMHARNHPEWSSGGDGRSGIDCFLVAASPGQMAFFGKIAACYAYLFTLVIPPGLLVAFLALNWQEVSLGYKIIQPVVPVIFNLIDLPLHKASWNTGQLWYWKQSFGRSKDVLAKEDPNSIQELNGTSTTCCKQPCLSTGISLPNSTGGIDIESLDDVNV
ncbi:unknown protein [Seminavis robusta]|uniref:Uncharacterized protein n=1 Tax=Seminavis robusta TaxID=568900 RepID=A0A9N8EDB8_9STRA|nr:unknown protein [Seminavis robusta]|eukprot:Sro778_g201090.1 n/a (365) ;mRNA; f:5346-6440